MNAELVNLAIGEVVVGVNSVVPQVTPPSPPPSPSPAPVLPRTGAGPLPAYVPLGLLAIGGAALVAFRRRRGLG
jgi:LPXTG-motif cell wall-anchored protein